MQIDFSDVNQKKIKLSDLQERYTHADLIAATNTMLDTMLGLIHDARDEFISFVPHDPNAYDPDAVSDDDANIAWTLGHVIVHATASGEETAALGATLARGVVPSWRNRYEVPWQTVTTVQQVRERLEDSRRIRLAYLDAWGNSPQLDVYFTKLEDHLGALNAVGYTLWGLRHDNDHLDQIAEIMRQGREQFQHA